MSFDLLLFWQVNVGKYKHCYYHPIVSTVCTIEWTHCEWYTLWPWLTFSRSRIIKIWISRKRRELEINTHVLLLMNVVLCDIDLHFQGQAFSCYAFVIKKRIQQISPANLPRLARPVVELLLLTIMTVLIFVVG